MDDDSGLGDEGADAVGHEEGQEDQEQELDLREGVIINKYAESEWAEPAGHPSGPHPAPSPTRQVRRLLTRQGHHLATQLPNQPNANQKATGPTGD